MLDLIDLRVSYGHLEVLHGVTMSVGDGEFVALLGSNGAGKTTLLKTCAGLLRPRNGDIVIDGVSVKGTPPQKLPGLGVAVALGGHRVFHRQSVLANLELGGYVHGRGDRAEEDFERVFTLFPVLKRKAKAPASTLSGGERQMLAIGQALMSRPRILLLDEPSAGLAPLLVEMVFEVFHQLRDQGMSLLLAEQTVEQALELCDRGYVLEAGSVVLSGSTTDLKEDGAVQAAYVGSFGPSSTASDRSPVTGDGRAEE